MTNLASNVYTKDHSTHSFPVEWATALNGMEYAVFLSHVDYWINYNKRLGKNLREGRYWTFQTLEEMHNHFPYLSIEQLRRITKRLNDEGILLKGQFNDSKWNKTIWYSIDYEKLETLISSKRRNQQIENKEPPNRVEEDPKSNKEYINKSIEQSCCLAAPPPPPVREFSKEDLIKEKVELKKDWTEHEIDEAWKRYSQAKITPTHPVRYVEGIIKNMRSLPKPKENKPKETPWKPMSYRQKTQPQEVKKLGYLEKQKLIYEEYKKKGLQQEKDKLLANATLVQPFPTSQTLTDLKPKSISL